MAGTPLFANYIFHYRLELKNRLEIEVINQLMDLALTKLKLSDADRERTVYTQSDTTASIITLTVKNDNELKNAQILVKAINTGYKFTNIVDPDLKKNTIQYSVDPKNASDLIIALNKIDDLQVTTSSKRDTENRNNVIIEAQINIFK